MEGVMTIREAARELGLSPASLRSAIRDGRLHVIQLHARTNVVTRDEVERYRREHLGKRGRRKKAAE